MDNNVKNEDLVTILYYKLYSMRNGNAILSDFKDNITIREEEVYKSGKKTCMINGDRWSHEEVNNSTHKECICYDHYRVVVKHLNDNPEDDVQDMVNTIKCKIQGSKDQMIKELKELVTGFEQETVFTVKDRR